MDRDTDADRVGTVALTNGTINDPVELEAVLREAGLDDFHFHDLRHPCGSWLVQSGVSLAEREGVFGHSTIRMTERYAHNAPENSRAAVERLDALAQFRLTGTAEH